MSTGKGHCVRCGGFRSLWGECRVPSQPIPAFGGGPKGTRRGFSCRKRTRRNRRYRINRLENRGRNRPVGQGRNKNRTANDSTVVRTIFGRRNDGGKVFGCVRPWICRMRNHLRRHYVPHITQRRILIDREKRDLNTKK